MSNTNDSNLCLEQYIENECHFPSFKFEFVEVIV